MKWDQVRRQYPDQWLVIDAIEAHSKENLRRIEQFAVVSVWANGSQALKAYQELHSRYPEREYYYVHTSLMDLSFEERHWVGIRKLQKNHESHIG